MKDPMWVTGLRIIHITCGFFAFFIAPVVLAMVKGGKQHRRWGKVYFWMMAVVAATALVLGFYRPIVFLALIAVFSFYMAFVGYRVLYRKQPRQGQGGYLRPPQDQNFWWYDHMGGMIGSYIAAVSAFSVVNLRFLPPLVRWLWPVAIGVPVILLWIRYYKKRFAEKRAAMVA